MLLLQAGIRNIGDRPVNLMRLVPLAMDLAVSSGRTDRVSQSFQVSGSPSEWLITGLYCWYMNEEAGSNKPFGTLYNWQAVNSGKLAPAGWHAANETEYFSLKHDSAEINRGGIRKASGLSVRCVKNP